MTQESSLRVAGEVKESTARAPGIPGGYEIDVRQIEIVQIADAYPISPKEHGIEFLMQNRHLWLRSSRQWAAMRVRAVIIRAIRDWLDEPRLSQRRYAHPHAGRGRGHHHPL